MINTFSLKIIGTEDYIKHFKDYLKSNKMNVNISIRSSSSDDKVILHLVIRTQLEHLSHALHDWFKNHNSRLEITGDKYSVDMPEMDEIIFSCNDSQEIIIKKLEDLADRQKHYESNVNKSLKSWKSRGII